MKRMLIVVVFLLGCASRPQVESPESLPELVSQEPLPAIPRSVKAAEFRLDLELQISENGSVKSVHLVTSSGDPEWDKRAQAIIMNWRFSPAVSRGKPVPIWIRQTAILKPADALVLNLAVLECPNKDMADSVYALLLAGGNFEELVRSCSVAPSRDHDGLIGEVDVRTYPVGVQQVLRGLAVGELTGPCRIGFSYFIFKRVALTPVTQSYALR